MITALYFAIVAVPAGLALRGLTSPENESLWVANSGVALLLGVIGFICWLLAPRSYEFDKTKLTINRPAGKIIIPLNSIGSADELPREELAGMIRTFGVGGLFGYYGAFWAPRIGHVRMHATCTKGLVLIVTTTGKKIIISPDDGSFAAGLRAAL